ncbi:MAG: VOC family protein [Bacillus sp. (in: firmicutes)]
MGFHQKPNLYIRDVSINVMDLQRSLAFYRDFLGFKVLEEGDRYAALTADGKTALIKLYEPEGVLPKEPRKTGLYHFAILLPSREELGKILIHLIKHNYRLGASDHLVSEALYLNDPDGNGIEIYRDREDTDWTWDDRNQVEMTTDPLDGEGVIAAAQGAPWEGMPAETVMGHIHLHVSHLQEAGKFYKEILGYEIVCEYGGQALFISTGKYHHHIGMNTWNGAGAPAPSENSVGLREYSISIPDQEYKQNIIRSLEQSGLAYEEENGVLYTKDPSQNNIAFYVES